MKIRVTAEGFELTAELEKYVSAKLAHLGKQVPSKLRPMASCEVHFAQTHRQDIKLNTCGVTVGIDGTQLKAEETTQHMYAALDIAVVNIEQQLKDYAARQKQGLGKRLKRSLKGDDWLAS